MSNDQITNDQIEELAEIIGAPAHCKQSLRARLPFVVAGRLGMARHAKSTWDYVAHQSLWADTLNAIGKDWHDRSAGEQGTPVKDVVEMYLRHHGYLA